MLFLLWTINTSSRHTDNRQKYILVFGEGANYGFDDTTIMGEAKYSVNITKSGEKNCLSLHYNANNSFKNLSVQRKGLWNRARSIVFEKYIKRLIVVYVKKPGLNGLVYFSVIIIPSILAIL